jgi:hypothetical protein
MIANRPKAVFFIRPSKFENGRPKDGWTVGWLRPWHVLVSNFEMPNLPSTYVWGECNNMTQLFIPGKRKALNVKSKVHQ